MTENKAPTPETPKRMTLSHVVERLLDRESQGSSSSSVTLSRNAKGETLIEVVARVGGDGGPESLAEADKIARTVYDALRADYPMLSGNETGERSSVTLSRNAKGETQIEVSESGESSEVESAARIKFDRLRETYPMSTGFVGAHEAVSPSKGSGDGGQA